MGNKLDLQQNPTTINRSTHLHERASHLLEKYSVHDDDGCYGQNIESCIECSACSRQNVRQVFYVAQRAIAFPTAPLYDKSKQELTPQYERILRRVFRYFDRDNDRLWSAQELNQFQVVLFRPYYCRNTVSPPSSPIRKSGLSSRYCARSHRKGFCVRSPILPRLKTFLRRDSRNAVSCHSSVSSSVVTVPRAVGCCCER